MNTKYNLPKNRNPFTWGQVITKHEVVIKDNLHQILVSLNSNGNVYVVNTFHDDDDNLCHDVMLYINYEFILEFHDTELDNGSMFREIRSANFECETLIYD